jgi:hypothetical protein
MSAGPDQNRMRYFALLDEHEQHEAIRRLARSGMGDHTISSITGSAVEAVRRILGKSAPCEGCDQ